MTRSTSKLTSVEICSIIKECKSAGVREFAFGELSISFLIPENNYESWKNPGEGPLPLKPAEVSNLKVRAKSKKDEFRDILEEARLADPVLYEELIEIEDMNEINDD